MCMYNDRIDQLRRYSNRSSPPYILGTYKWGGLFLTTNQMMALASWHIGTLVHHHNITQRCAFVLWAT